jgi:hypothetical protein
VAFNGEVVQELALGTSKVLIGRSDCCDLCIDEPCVSRFEDTVTLGSADDVRRAFALGSTIYPAGA